MTQCTRAQSAQSHLASLGDRLIVAVILTATLLLAGIAIAPRSIAYAAPNPNSQKENLWWRPANYSCVAHCYSVVKWWAPYSGAQTQNTVVPIDCPASACWQGANEAWHVNEAVWLADNGTCQEGNGKDCDSWAANNCGQPLACWVEAGYWAVAVTSTTTWYFYYWADQRPCGGGYWNHYGIDFRGDMWSSSTDKIQGSTGSGSQQCNGTTNNTWSVSVITPGHRGPVVSGTSTANPMSPNEIQIGTELVGSCCAVASGNDFILNQGVDNGSWFYLGTNYTTHHDAPLVGYWNNNNPPANGQGGDWRTGCTGSGSTC